jgi:serine/threonine-protein kinase RsbW
MADQPSLNPIASCDAPASMDSWELFNGFVEEQSDAVLGASPAGYKLRLACEELLSNMIRHAISDADGAIQTHLWVRAFRVADPQPALVIELEDNGAHFDPKFDRPREIDTDLAIQDRPIGGLGLFLVQQSVDLVEYNWVEGRNRYRLFVVLPSSSRAAQH